MHVQEVVYSKKYYLTKIYPFIFSQAPDKTKCVTNLLSPHPKAFDF